MQNKKEFSRIFREVLKDKTSLNTKELFARWFVWLDVADHNTVFRDEQEGEEISGRMESNLLTYTQKVRGKQRFIQPYKIAAALVGIIIIAAGVLTIPQLFTSTPSEILVWSESSALTAERKIVLMPDGSRITLNNASKIRYVKNFKGPKREIFLEGEAFFDVMPDKTRPFIVHTAQLDVTVLGTSFNIRHYPDDPEINVVVATGTVSINDQLQKSWTLTRGNILSYDSLTGIGMRSMADPHLYTAWQHGELIFQNEKLVDICKRLERWYGIPISIKNSTLREKRLSLREKNENLRTVMHMLELAGGLTAEIKDHEIIIR